MFLEKIKDKMFFMYYDYNNDSFSLTEYSRGLKTESFDISIYSVVKIGHIFSDFIEILYIDNNTGIVIDNSFYPISKITSVFVDYE